MALATRVIDFSTGQSVAASGVSVFLDELLNVDSEGEPVSQFAPGDTIHLLATIPDDLRFVRAVSTAGTLTHNGLVSRSQTDQILFAVVNEAQSLSRQAQGNPNLQWYGRAGNINTDLEFSTVSAAPGSPLPCLADATYPYQAESMSLATTMMTLAEGETWPYGIVVYVEVLR